MGLSPAAPVTLSVFDYDASLLLPDGFLRVIPFLGKKALVATMWKSRNVKQIERCGAKYFTAWIRRQ